MGGIAGYLGKPQVPDVLTSMVGKLAHRGRSSEGFYAEQHVHMGVRRLAMLDMTSGDQPMYSDDRKIAIVFNGEIYNYRQERDELIAKGYKFTTHSDTEVILKLYLEYGVNCVNRLRGMFAFAIHDQNKDFVFIARDRLGVKPLYYTTTQSGDFVFASEIKSILEHPGVHAVPDMVGIDAFLSMRYSPGPDGMFKGIHKLPAGHRLLWNPGLHVDIESYWHWDDYKYHDTSLHTDKDFQDRFDELFDEAVHLSMGADAPMGAFLSGGIDSSAIVASMAKQSSDAINTFTVGFDWEGDELEAARAVSDRLGTQHNEVVCTTADFDKLPELIWALDEPVGDPVILPMHLLSQLAGQSVRGVLTGDGADEMLAGYGLHQTLLRAHNLPPVAYKLLKPVTAMMPSAILDLFSSSPEQMGARGKRKLVDFMGEMQTKSLSHQYHFLMSLFDATDKKKLYHKPMRQVMDTFIDSRKDDDSWPSTMAAMLAQQQAHGLQDDILTKLDKMSMLSSLEGRVPFLDHKLVEFLLSAPDHLKRKNGRDKVLLRNYTERHLPGVGGRPKKPSRIPLQKYLSMRPLKDMMEMCLSEKSVQKRGLFDYDAVKYILAEMRSGNAFYARQAFSLLSLELWFRIYIDNEKGWISS